MGLGGSPGYCFKSKIRKNKSCKSSTKICKHMTTLLQLLDLNNEELEWVSEHLGHNVVQIRGLNLSIDKGCYTSYRKGY